MKWLRLRSSALIWRVFNMGLGMMVIVRNKDADLAVRTLKANGENARVVGRTVRGAEGVGYVA